MKSPQDMQFIQIDITNACSLKCSNCTRFCGNHKDAFFMDFETFKRAVDSLDGFEGVTGIIGGEPTLHPRFEDFARYLQQVYGKQDDHMPYPEKNFIHKMQQREFSKGKCYQRPDGSHYIKKHGAGLWSNMGIPYRKHYELIQDTFSIQFLNDHLNPSYHQPGLVSRKDLGIPDAEWIPMRDACWMQNSWSATITPKGAFFCEVAGALDMLFDGPGGWKIEPGWWKRRPEEFGEQLKWCELCGFALPNIFSRDAQEETDDASPTLYEKLKEVNSPKLKNGKVNLIKIENGVIREESRTKDHAFLFGVGYIEKYEDRFQEKNSVLFEMDVEEICMEDGAEFGRKLAGILWGKTGEARESRNGTQPDGYGLLRRKTGEAEGSRNGTQTDGYGLLRRKTGEAKAGKMSWVLLKTNPDADTSELDALSGRAVFNPGSLHLGGGYAFFCAQALSLRGIEYDSISHMTSLEEIIQAWDPGKVIRLRETEKETNLARASLAPGKAYAIWGAGIMGEYFADSVRYSGGRVAFLVDRSPDKIGKTWANADVYDPKELQNRSGEYDVLLIANQTYFEEIKRDAIGMGVPEEKILLPYEV